MSGKDFPKQSFSFELIKAMTDKMDKEKFTMEDLHYIFNGIQAVVKDKNYDYKVTIEVIDKPGEA